jgi:hypothetical protein
MSVFTNEEIEYLNSQLLGRLATVGPDGQPHVVPVSFHYNAQVDTTSPGGRSTRMSSATQGWRSSWTTWSPWIRGGRAGSRSAARPRCSVAGARRSAPASPRICSASARSGS